MTRQRRVLLVDHPWFPWAATASVWVVLTIVNVANVFLRVPGLDQGERFRWHVLPQIVLGFSWILLAPLAIGALRRHPLNGSAWLRSVPYHVVWAAFLGTTAVAVFQVGGEVLRPVPRPLASIGLGIVRNVRYNLHDSFLYYAVTIGAALVAQIGAARRARERAAAAMKEQVAEARLDALRFRLQPDFILSTLGTLLPLIERDPVAASRTVVRLGEVLHRNYRSDQSRFSTVRDEIQLLGSYLEIERARHGDRLEALLQPVDEELADGLLPPLLLLPLVQHAIAIGVLDRPGRSRIALSVRREGDRLLLTVTEQGEQPYRDARSVLTVEDPDSVALRLRRLHGQDSSLRRRLLSPASLSVEIRIPFRIIPRGSLNFPERPSDVPSGACHAPVRSAAAPAPPASLLGHPVLTTLALLLFFALYFGSQCHLQISQSNAIALLSWFDIYGPSFARMAIWAALAPALLLACRLFPLDPRPRPMSLVAHVLLAALFAVAVPVALGAISPAFPPAFYDCGTPPAKFMKLSGGPLALAALRLGFLSEFVTYVVLAALRWAWGAYQKMHEEEARALHFEAALASARLGALESQLRPHFLFNTLNAVLPLIEKDPRLAMSTIVQLGDILRTALDADSAPLVPLSEEIDFCRRYLEIEKTRFRDRLAVTFDVEPGVLPSLVPNLILQPVVENAIKHGISRNPGSGKIRISARRRSGRVVLEVVNSAAPNADELQTPSAGLGLSNVRQRLEQLFGDDSTFRCRRLRSGDFEVIIGIPLEIPETPRVDEAVAS
jgi:two-component system, LytTR family, sensor kinase